MFPVIPFILLAAFAFPWDHGPHKGAGREWWYFSGMLKDQYGKDYSFCYIILRFLGLKYCLVVSNIVDLGTGRLVFGEVERCPITIFEKPSDGDWYIGYLGGRVFVIRIRKPSFSLDLRVRGLKPLVLHGDSGYINMGGKGETSAYYSYTRMSAEGVMIARGETLELTGDAWMDHQWGSWSAGSRYDWFSFRFEDTTELMLYRFREEDGRPMAEYLTGTYVDRNGNSTVIEDFQANPQDHYWIESDSVKRYPLRWRVKVPSLGIDVSVEALAEDQFFWLDERHLIWEGACRITEGNKKGYCFLEMAGY